MRAPAIRRPRSLSPLLCFSSFGGALRSEVPDACIFTFSFCCRQKFRQAEIHQLTDRLCNSHSAPVAENRSSPLVAQDFCNSHQPSEQDLTVLAPEAYSVFVLPHLAGVIPGSVGNVDQSAQPC